MGEQKKMKKKMKKKMACMVVMVGMEAKQEDTDTMDMVGREQKRTPSHPKEPIVSMKKLIRCSVEILEQQQEDTLVGREQKRTPSHPKEPIVFIQKFKASLRCSVEVITLEMLMK